MHQPYYGDDVTGEVMMPWVRLHALKNYYDIPVLLSEAGGLKMTYNLVPSLIEQVNHIIEGRKDQLWQLCEKPIENLTDEEKKYIINYCFKIHRNLINHFTRYRDLWQKHERGNSDFSNRELNDLRTLFHLAWSGWELRKEPFVSELINKGTNYNNEDIMQLLDIQRDFVGRILIKYRELASSGKIDISCTPFYHPILPLLVDQKIACVSREFDPLPPNTMKLENEAKTQISRGIDFFKNEIGFAPSGMWPSEGSVSDDALRLIADSEIKWAATDDEILAKSNLSSEINRDSFLQPHQISFNDNSLVIFFRNHSLSDRIGFTYSRMNPRDAAEDFISELRRLYDNSTLTNPHLSIILDGENAWEYFPDHGYEFLSKLGEALRKADWLDVTTFSDFLEKFGMPDSQINSIHPGSWIYANFATWIGHPEKNRAWEILIKTIEDFESLKTAKDFSDEIIEKVKREIQIAEGSDWFWWYGDDHHTEFAAEFDSAFRTHLINVYKILSETPPDYLFEPIINLDTERKSLIEPFSFINPVIDGMNKTFFEWRGSGSYNPKADLGAIHKSDIVVDNIRFGFNPEYLYFRLHPAEDHSDSFENLQIEVSVSEPTGQILLFDAAGRPVEGEKIDLAGILCRRGETTEIQIPWDYFSIEPGEVLHISINLRDNNKLLERYPVEGRFSLERPDEDFENRNWII